MKPPYFAEQIINFMSEVLSYLLSKYHGDLQTCQMQSFALFLKYSLTLKAMSNMWKLTHSWSQQQECSLALGDSCAFAVVQVRGGVNLGGTEGPITICSVNCKGWNMQWNQGSLTCHEQQIVSNRFHLSSASCLGWLQNLTWVSPTRLKWNNFSSGSPGWPALPVPTACLLLSFLHCRHWDMRKGNGWKGKHWH